MEPFWTSVDDETLREVGRLTLAAVQLEDFCYGVCRFIRPRHSPDSEPPIGTRIDEARSDCATDFIPGPAVTAIVSWLTEAAEALAARNAILHSAPVVFVPLPGTTPIPETTGPWLTHFPRKKKSDLNRKPAVHTRLTSAAVKAVRERLDRACAGWVELLDPLETSRVPAG